MGNIVQCCHTLSNYFKCKDVPPQREQERSPLLSSEEGECDPSSEPDDVEEDEFYTSTNPTLEPGNFLFPDIILSSSLGGDMTLVEPMVCLLVSEEEERVRVFEEGDAAQSRRYRGNSEVETQTEMETQVRTGVQTQTELRTHSEIFVCHDSTVESKVKTLTNTGTIDVVCGKHEILRREDVLVGAQTVQMSQERHAEKQKMRAQAEAWTDADSFVELEVSGRLTERRTLAFMEAKREELKGTQEELSTILSETLTEDKENMDEYLAATESQRNVQLTEHVENFNPAECVALTPQIDQSADQAVISAHHIQGREKTQQTKRIEDPSTPGLLEAEGPTMSLNSADRLFLTGSHFKAPLSEDSSNDGLCQPPDSKESKQFSIHDAADLKDTSFTLRIQPPGTETFELQVSGQLLVAELHQVLMEHEITCQRTCFSLQMGGAALDNHAKLCSIQGIQDGALIKVEEELYSVRDARLHLKHVRALLRSLDPADAHNGVNCSSLSYVSVYTRGDKGIDGVGNKRPFFDIRPSEYLLPGCKDRLLTPLLPVREDRKPLQCLRVLTLSSWNPPPGNRKMHGDLMYLNVLTMEGKELNITSSTRGFYINQSTAFNFNPKPAEAKILCHSLVELLNQISPAFRKSFIVLQKKRVQQHPYERIATPFQVFTWIAPQGDYTLDCIKAEETQASRVGQEEHTAGQTRDWNEELQACRELSRRSFQECLHRERMIFKTNSDFVGAATQGAVAVIDGNVMPLNPGEAPHMQMFIWNNLFFSLGFDISDHYRPLGGNSAAHAAAVCDLRGAQAYSNVDAEGLHTVGTAVVDYRGIRVIAQTIVPGLLEKHQEQTVVYGSNDYGKTVFTHPRFLELLGKTSKQLRIQRHQVLDHNNSPVELCSGIETKGIFGNDSRAYVLDLLRTFPPDLNFQFSDTEDSREVPEECKSFGYPRRHQHTLASLRPELIEAFVQHRYEMYVKMVPQSLDQLENLDTSIEQKLHRRTVIGNACKAVGSVSESCFDIRFNPDVCSPGVRFSSECVAEVQKQRMLLWDAAAFLLSHQIPALLRDCLDHTAVPMDGLTLTSALHQRGVNVRYLGTILMELERAEGRGRLSHIQRISLSEVIIRSAKHIFQTFLQDVEPAAFSAAVCHFLNCLLSSSSCVLDSCSDELVSRRRSRRRRSQRGRVALLKDNVWTKLTPSELWSRIKTEVGNYFHYTIDNESIDEVIEKHSLQRISLLREIAIKTGIQVQLREYVFDSRHRPAFSEEDVINMFPVVKHLKHTASDAKGLVQHARALIQQGHVKDGYDLINQALVLFVSVCGVLHEDVCMCLHLLGRLSYIMGEYADALSHQEKAVINSERVQGIDHPQTIQHYTHLALYCFAGGRQSTSLQLLYRARYLTLLVSGEDHPHIIQVDSMLGLILHGLMEYELSLTFLQNALSLTSKYYGTTSLNCAHSHHLLAAVYDSKGDFHSAVQHEKEAHSIYYNQAGEDHDITKESSEYLSSLTQQALSLQNPTEHVCSSTPSACTPSAKFSAPSCPTILRQLNLTCGIIELSVKNTELRMGIQEMWKSWK